MEADTKVHTTQQPSPLKKARVESETAAPAPPPKPSVTEEEEAEGPSGSSDKPSDVLLNPHYVEAPNPLSPMQAHTTDGTAQQSVKSLFLAGGISNCPDWQVVASRKLLAECKNLVVANPRRTNLTFDQIDPLQQIKWEHDALRDVSARMFWFPSATLCPITLYELGAWTILSKQNGQPLFIGCDPQYARKQDVEVQTRLVLPELKVHDNLDTLLDAIIAWYATI
eukprot:TRINITY_DN3320_c0_g1_i1.p1 TRINITY_DN3320_c0_g1~~TRINITY_DN3320_c0_g1_i1.p1  ORF type:complete len:225 (+),score=43.06 TRINITY_DN3320_c0_g1_i1:89-763(+)